MTGRTFVIRPMTEADATSVATWRYPNEFAFYMPTGMPPTSPNYWIPPDGVGGTSPPTIRTVSWLGSSSSS
jgi:hypothetical protein